MSIYKKNIKIFVSDVEMSAKNYISSKFYDILPFEVFKGNDFQIRISIEQYKKLSTKIKKILKKYAVEKESLGYDDEKFKKMERRYAKDFFWTGSNSYIFDYTSIHCITIEENCTYGYEGLESSKSIHFIDRNEFPELILLNIGKYEGDEFVIKNKIQKKAKQNNSEELDEKLFAPTDSYEPIKYGDIEEQQRIEQLLRRK